MRRGFVALGVCTALVLAGSGQIAQAQTAPAGMTHKALLDKNCITCHNERNKANAGRLALDGVDVARPADRPEVWEKVIGKLETGLMPPAGRPRPEPAARVRVRNLNIGQFPHPVTKGAMSSIELAQKLIKAGAQVDGLTEKGFNDGWRGFFGPKATAFLLAAKGGDTEMMRLLAANGANVFHKNATGSNAVMVAAGVDMFNPNEDSGTDAEGLAALTLALELGKGKFDVNETNRNGEAALHGAMHRNSTQLVRVLVDAGAKLDLKNKRGLMAIQIANGEDNFIGMIGRRQERIDQLRELMVTRGLTFELRDDAAKIFNFGVKAEQ